MKYQEELHDASIQFSIAYDNLMDQIKELKKENKRLKEIVEAAWECGNCGNWVTNERAMK